MKNKKPFAIAATILATAIALAMLTIRSKPATQLPEGTTVELAHVGFTTNFNYIRIGGARWARQLRPIIPDSVEKLVLGGRGEIHMGSSSDPKLLVAFELTKNILPNIQPSQIAALRVRDDHGNRFDGASDYSSTSMDSGNGAASVHVLSSVPRRSPVLYLEPLFDLPKTGWTNLGPFEIENPWFSEYPQWTPEEIPQSRTNGRLVLTLDRLLSGGVFSDRSEQGKETMLAEPRVTRLEFSFHEAGRKIDHHRIHSTGFSDATGNQWRREPDPYEQRDHAWTTNGVVELIGALWPGENAWKIEVQTLQTGNFDLEDVWEVPPISLPEPATHHDLTNQFQFGPISVQLANIAAPDAQSTNSGMLFPLYFRHHHGVNEPAYAVGFQINGASEQNRLVVVEATDQKKKPIRLVEHVVYPGHSRQALFFDIPNGVTELNLKLAFPKLKTFKFIARPEFVN